MLTTSSACATLPPELAGSIAGPSTAERATPPASRAEANLAARIRGIFMSHLRHTYRSGLGGFPRGQPLAAIRDRVGEWT